ncbi:MAG TPA: alpha/beta fold hydrolase [Sporichthya sp.]|nr:alpha/beta fold hydrolase [Sporichthya sp.]
MTSPLFRRAGLSVLAATLLATALPATAANAARTPSSERVCTETIVPLAFESAPLVPGDTFYKANKLENQQMFVRFCQPTAKPSSTVQVLVHGITYDHNYWNIADPDGTERYSWEAAAISAGYATLSIDRLGAGMSSHPPSYQVDINSNAASVKALIHELRTGKIAAPVKNVPVHKVVLVGHSYGSMTSWFVASNNPEVDAVVLTGATHNIREIQSPLKVASPLYPSFLDPAYSSKAYDPGYLTIRPGTRVDPFYAPDTDFDPRVLAADEATKGTVTFSELNNYPAIFRTPLDIRVPVFLLIGTKDGIFCSLDAGDMGAPCDTAEHLIASEGPQLGPHVPSVDAYIIDGAGHAINAVHTSQESFAAAQSWIHEKVSGGSHNHDAMPVWES